MRTFNKLDKLEQERAIRFCFNELIKDFAVGKIKFNDNTKIQKTINKLFEKASKNQTPWFLEEYIRDDSYLFDKFTAMAKAMAKAALYPDCDEEIPKYIYL